MFNVDSPGFPLALLAILVGARLIMYVIERLFRQAPVPATAVLTPDESAEPAVVSLAGSEPTQPADAPTAENTVEADAPSVSRFFAELLDSGIIAVILVFFIIRPFVLQAFFIPTGSMVPTLREKDRLLATKYIYHFREPRRGEVIVFHAPKLALDLQPEQYNPAEPVEYVKRVIGVPHDRIRIKHYDGVYINGKRLNEPYISAKPNYDFPLHDVDISQDAQRQISKYINSAGELVVPEGYLFVLGDNRNGSLDGHAWGLLKRDRVIGKVFCIFWPLERFGRIR